MLKIASLLLQKNSIRFDKEEFSFQIQSHPSYPSLHSITGVFDHFNIENVAAKVPVKNEVIQQLPNYFIAQITGDNGLDLVLVEKSNNQYLIYNSQKKKKKISKEDFLKKFTGIILAVEKSDSSEEKVSHKNLIIKITSSLVIISILTLFFQSTSSTSFYLLLLLSIVGVFISISIVKQEFGIKNTIGDAFCSSIDEKKDCDAVLSSKGATIFKGHKLSDLSLVYFIGYGLCILLLSLQGLSLNFIYLVTLISLPITIYSIYSQAYLIKKWCLLCLSIVGVLWLQAVVLFYDQNLTFKFHLRDALTVIASFLLIFSIWSILKPFYIEASKNKKLKLDYFKFKRKYTLFSTLLKSKPVISTEINNFNEIVFGNKDSHLEIVVLTNPFCGHCKPVHKIIEDILHQHKESVKIIIRFNINLNDTNSDVVKITSNLLNIYFKKGQKVCLTAMNEAYNILSPKLWLEKWSDIEINKEHCFKILKDQDDWCLENKINFTPELLVNGRSFPKEYKRSDLAFFIEELNEELTLETTNNRVSS